MFWNIKEVEEKVDRNHVEVIEKLEELSRLVKQEGANQEARTARIARMMRPRSTAISDDHYRAEEARIVASLQKDEENLAKVKEMTRRVRSRRKVKPEAPRPMRAEEIPVIDIEEDNATGE